MSQSQFVTNQGVTANGMIALAGDCWDNNGNKIGSGSVVLRIINGCIATIAITNTLIGGGSGIPVGAVAFLGIAPTVSVS